MMEVELTDWLETGSDILLSDRLKHLESEDRQFVWCAGESVPGSKQQCSEYILAGK